MLKNQEPLFNDSEAAAYLGLQKGTLQVWRCTKRYPLKYLKVGRNVRYRKSDLDEFLQSRVVGERTAA